MSSEQRVIRPYVGVDEIERAIAGASVLFGSHALTAGGRVTVSTHSFMADRFVLRLAEDEGDFEKFLDLLEQGLAAMEVDTDKAEVMLLLSTTRLKRVEISWRRRVSELAPEDFSSTIAHAESRPVPLQTPFGGCTATLYVALAESLPPKPLRPHRKGTWLARSEFKIVTDLGEIGFTPYPLNDEIRQRLALSPKALRYTVVEDPLLPSPGADAVVVYVDEDVLAQLTTAPYTPGAKAFQRQLFLDAMTAVVHSASHILSEDEGQVRLDDIEGSLLGNLLQRMAMPRSGDRSLDLEESYLEMVQADPGRFLTFVEGWIPQFDRAIADALAEGA